MKRLSWLIGVSIGALMNIWAQSDVSLRGRIVSNLTHQRVSGYCGVEFGLAPAPGADPQVVVCFGEQGGASFYAYVPGSGTVSRIGRLQLGVNIVDVDVASGASNQEAYLAWTRSDGGVYLVRYTHGSSASAVVAPYGLASLSASRTQIERLASGSYLVVVGTSAGRLRAYVWTPGSPAAEPNSSLSLGTAAVDVPLFSGAVRAVRAWTVSGVTYVAAGGYDGIVYLLRWDGTGLVQVGKAMYHPAPIAEIVVNGSRLVVGCTNGQVYVWNYTSSSVVHHLTLKEPWSPLDAHSLCALPNDRVAVATAFVRVYSLANGAQVGEYGGALWGAFLNDFYWYGWQFSAYLWQPYFYRLERVRVLPALSSNQDYFVMTALQSGGSGSISTQPRTAFLQPPSGLSYQVVSGTHPVYALTYAGNGVVSGRANGALQAPWGSRTVNEPVFALESFTSGTTSWVLGSYGVGRLFAWSSAGAFVADVLPAPSSPRIVYQVRVVSVSGGQVTFVTSGGDGSVELWQWTIGSTTPATRLSNQSVPRPLHSLSVNADRSEVAVASSLLHAGGAWRLSLGGTSLGAPAAFPSSIPGWNSSIAPFFANYVAYHPTDPNLLAWSAQYGHIWLYNRATNIYRLVQGGQIGRWWTYYGYQLAEPLLLAWRGSDTLVGAYAHNGYVGVWWTGADTVTNSKAPDGTTDNPIRGGFDRAFQDVYEPHRDRVYALLVAPNGDFVSGSADGRVVRWSRSGQPVATTYHLSYLSSVDFSPLTGQLVHPSRVFLTDTQHALLWSNLLGSAAVLALNVPGGSSTIQARTLSATTADVTSSDVAIRYLVGGQDPDYPLYNSDPSIYVRFEASEDGSWVMLNWPTIRVQISSNPPQYERRARVHLIPHTRLSQLATASADFYRVVFPDSTAAAYTNHALSPGGVRVAICDVGQPIRVYDRSGSSWNLSTPTSTIAVTLPQVAYLKFLADDVLAVAYPAGTPSQLRIDVYQLSGTTWTLRQTLDTNLPRSFGSLVWRYYMDAVAVGTNVRVAVACDTGLVFYRMSRSGGVVSLTEVGRSTWSANGFLDVAGHYWVRFSRYNPNLLGVANGAQAVVFDLTGQFSW
ncbi:hypothetical protein HRbin15_00050 [bacterium HR15]|nr:hypothetical protein HRbin15_00050 [bacterium HR15]